MKKSNLNEAGSFNPRLFVSFLLGCAALMLAMFSFASTPSNGMLTDSSGPITYTAGPFNQPNQSPAGAGQLDVGPRCGTSGFTCDSYLLTITLPSGYTTTYPGAAVKVTAGWTDKGTGQADYDLYIYKGNVPTTDGSRSADYQSASGANPEIATIFPLIADGQPHQYTVKLVPYLPTGETLNVRIELFSGAASSGGGGGGTGTPFGGADPTVAGNPRYLNFYAPRGSSAEASSGEYNIGFNPKTGRIMNMNSGPIWRITPPERLVPAKPECCEGLWEDRSSIDTNVGLDPILWTDQKTGRTFASNSTAGPNALYAFSDDDGDTWVPVGVAPPTGADHQTIATGPYPPSLSALSTPLNQGQYALYCSQDLVGANCNRSDDLGSIWGPAIVATGPGATNSQGCGGLHGHTRVAPDGTAYLPDKSCGSVQGGAFTLDANTLPWTEFQVQKSVADTNGPAFTATPQADGADPSIGIDAGNTLYYCYVNNQANGTEGHAHVAVGKRVGSTINWIRDADVGATHGVVNAAHTEAIAGDAGRAACGFFGTNVPGNYEDGNFSGQWYSFIATTYDEGVTWTTVNATPNDPVQSMTGIWQRGGSGDQGDRNLLDFNEITIDDKGRVLYGYSDGCTSPECVGGTAKSNLGASMRVARQSGGRPLFARFDPVEPAAPKQACLSGTRDQSGSHLSWKAPDNNGADVTTYQILRGTMSGNEVLIATYNVVAGSKPEFTDGTADPNIAHYFYKIIAVNSAGAGAASNEIDLPVVVTAAQSPCTAPGITVLTDPSGDSLSPEPGTDLLSASVAQPYAADGNTKLIFTLKTDPAVGATHPTGSGWYLAMKLAGNDPEPAPQTGFHYRGVRMEYTSPATPSFFYYTPGSNSSGGVDGRFVDSETAAPGSYDPATGTITITLNASDLGLNPGSQILGFVSGSSQTTDPTNGLAGATEVWDSMPNSLAFAGSYTVTDNQNCRPNTAPTAVLTASPTSGPAPLTVNFSGAGSSDPDTAAPADTIASYSFTFGDGTSSTQTTPTVSHQYVNPGTYTASLTVTDSRGKASTNSATRAITVNGKPDLVITTLVASNNQAKQGDKVTFTATVKNQGSASAGASSTQFKLDGKTVLGTAATSSLAAGASVQVTTNWQTAGVKQGSHSIMATADSANAVVEGNETNNTNSVVVNIQGNKTK